MHISHPLHTPILESTTSWGQEKDQWNAIFYSQKLIFYRLNWPCWLTHGLPESSPAVTSLSKWWCSLQEPGGGCVCQVVWTASSWPKTSQRVGQGNRLPLLVKGLGRAETLSKGEKTDKACECWYFWLFGVFFGTRRGNHMGKHGRR